MSDPLSLLRNFVKNKKEFQIEDDKIVFDDLYYLKNVKTNYLIYGSGKDHKAKDYYTLECIVFLLKNRDLQHSLYIKNAGTRNVSVVLRPDRKELLSYLDGEIDTAPSVDKYAPIEIALQRPQLYVKVNSNASQKQVSKDEHDINNNSAGFHCFNDSNGQPAKEEILEKLNKKFDAQSSRSICENIIPLSEQLSVEKIISIKQKKKAQQRLKVTSDVDMQENILHIVPDYSARLSSYALSSNKSDYASSGFLNEITMMDTDDSDNIMREISRYEKVCRKRSNVLQSSGKQFDKDITAFLLAIENREQDNSKTSTNIIQSNNVVINQNVTSQKSRPLGYNRFDQERYSAKDETGGFSIDTKLSYQPNGGSITLSTATNSNLTSSASAAASSQATQNIFDNLASQTKSASLTSQSNPASKPQFQSTQLSQQKTNVLSSGNGISAHNNSKPKYQSSSASSSSKRIHATPIIIIPAARTSLIQMINASDILQELKFVSVEDKRKSLQNQSTHKEAEVIMHRKKDGTTVKLKVLDDVKKLRSEDWERIIAVFVHGAQWQFKDWQICDGNPLEIFSKIKAFHLKLSDTPLEPNIARWSARVIELDTNKRHLDRARLTQFWDDLNLN